MKNPFSLLVLCALVLSSIPFTASALSPVPPPPCFTPHIFLNIESFPDSLKLVPISQEMLKNMSFSTYESKDDVYGLVNTSNVPIYITKPSGQVGQSNTALSADMSIEANLPSSVRPIYKLASGETYGEGYYRDNRGEGFAIVKQSVPPTMRTYFLSALEVPFNTGGYAGSCQTTLPNAQPFSFMIYQNAQPYEIKGIISYSVYEGPYQPPIQSPNQQWPIYSFSRNLTIGSTGQDVIQLQTILESQGFLTIPQGVAKGYFGNATKAALARYQSSVGISPAAGYFGPLTRQRISMGNTTSNQAVDAKIKSELSGLRAAAEIVYDSSTGGSYANFCASGVINKDAVSEPHITALLQAKGVTSQAAAGIKCVTGGQAYALSIPLSTPGQTWCVDSTGNVGLGIIHTGTQRCASATMPAQY